MIFRLPAKPEVLDWSNRLKAILLFHMRVGGRLALQSFTPLFSAIVVAIMIQMYPAAMVAMIARDLFGNPPSLPVLAMVAALAFILPAWAAPRMSHGLNGWARHLPISSGGNRRGLAFALVIVQIPLLITLALLGFVAYSHGIHIPGAISVRLILLLIGAAFAAMPVKHRAAGTVVSIAGALLALFGDVWMIPFAAGLLVVNDFVSGPIRETSARRPWRPAGSMFAFRIAWRALGYRLVIPYSIALLPLAFMVLFIENNELSGGLLSGAARFGGGMAIVMFLSALSANLTVRRPVWPWARSLQWSSSHRVLVDALFLTVHAAPIILVVGRMHVLSALAVLALLPLLSFRAAGMMRRMPERRTGNAVFVLEGFLASSLVALIPWTLILVIPVTPVAFLSARSQECRQKVTRWVEKHHEAGGDSLSWSA